MKPICETEEEYLISKLMFLKFLNTQQNRSTLGKPFINAVEWFIKHRVEPYEGNFCYYLRKKYLNSLQEGANNATCHSVPSVKPSTNIENTFNVLTENSNCSYIKKVIERSKQLYRNKVYGL